MVLSVSGTVPPPFLPFLNALGEASPRLLFRSGAFSLAWLFGALYSVTDVAFLNGGVGQLEGDTSDQGRPDQTA